MRVSGYSETPTRNTERMAELEQKGLTLALIVLSFVVEAKMRRC